jgi:galactose-1-phosphate uridylyltransferase
LEQQLKRKALKKLLQATDITVISENQLQQFFYKEDSIRSYIPDGIAQIDPRNGDRVVFNSARSQRPHDNRPSEQAHLATASQKDCIICDGNTTGIVDLADLSQGFTFINKNRFPMLFPELTNSQQVSIGSRSDTPRTHGQETHGFHFLQWTSSIHNHDWHNMPQIDRIVVLKRLAALEKHLLTITSGTAKNGSQQDSSDLSLRYVSIIKNYGHLVGGSLIHGHQQIVVSNVMPRRILNHQQFKSHQSEVFSAFMLRENPPDLLVHDFGPAMLLVPYFMRRPFDLFLLLKDVGKRYVFELDELELAAVADGWHEAIRAIQLIMPQIGKETAYNVITNNGPGTGLYFEFLPYTQETGGFEHLGLYSCQGNPNDAADVYRKFIAANWE